MKNHMSALSAGLEATIREWFSEGAGQTAVETAEHVDLKAARKKAATQRRRRRKLAAGAAEEQEQAEAAAEEKPPVEAQQVAELREAVAVAEAEQPRPEVVAGGPQAAAAVEAEAPPAEAEEEARPAATAAELEPAAVAEAGPQVEAPPEAGEAEPELAPVAEKPEGPRAVPNKPKRPKIVKPAGPQVVPRPAKLQGPRVVRFVGVDEVGAPRRAGAPGVSAGPRPPTAPPSPGKAGRGAEVDERRKRSKRRSPRRRGGRGDVGDGLREWRDRDLIERSERLAAASGGTLRRHRAPVGRGRGEGQPATSAGKVDVEEPITVKSLSAATGIKIGDIIRRLMAQGAVATINQVLDRDAAETVAIDYGIELKVKAAKKAEDLLEAELARRTPGQLQPRAPIVTFLGHVDHGKTSLLDRIRHARVAEGEEGGITQHVGAYRYDVGDRHVVFLDTPGHEAFTAMRARGANMTDVVVLVVAADDGVMPQTIEAINHAKAAKVPIIVALNKIDLPNANVQRALGQLAEHGLQPRGWGGQTEVVQTSAVTGEGMDDLVETLSLEAELLELRADPSVPASGYVIEAERDSSRGVAVALLVREGVLRVGDAVLCGGAYGRVRTIVDDLGRSLQEAGPATPVEVTGLDEVPDAGDRFYVMADLGQARQVANERRQKARTDALAVAPQASLESMLGRIQAGETSELRLIVKADVQGSLEALLGSLERLGTDEVKLQVLHSGVGGISEGDVLLAEASEAVILGFRVVPDARARVLAEQKVVEVRTYRVIYQLIEDLEQAVQGMVAPEMVEEVVGRAEVREVFRISRIGSVAGCYVTEGMISRSIRVRLIRDNVVVEDERELDSLRRFKDDVREVRAGLECGMKIAGFDDVKVGDVIEAYRTVEVTAT